MRFLRIAHSLRAQLVLLVGVFTLCFLALGILATQRFLTDERQSNEAQPLASAAALGLSVEHEIRTVRGALVVLSNSNAIRQGDFETLYGAAKRSASELGDGIGFSLFTAEKHIFNTELPFGPALAFNPGPANLAIEQRREIIADPFFSPSLGRTIIIVSKPVHLPGAVGVRYALNAFFPVSRLESVVRTVEVSGRWVVAVFDSWGAPIVCSADEEVCTRAAQRSATVRMQSTAADLAKGVVVAHPGYRSPGRLTATVAIPGTQWHAHVSRPDGLQSYLYFQGPSAAIAVTAIALLAAALAAAILLSRRILHPLRELGAAANALGSDGDLRLGVAFRMSETRPIASALKHSQARILAESKELEHRVRERTRQLEQQAQELREARRGADAASEAKTQFLAQMAHEIRTPLTGVLGIADLMLAQQPSAREAEQLQLLRRSAESLKDLLNDALDFARIESGRLELHPRAFDPAALLNDVVQMFRAIVSSKDCVITLETHGLPRATVADVSRIRQVLVNLVGNAAKFTERGSIRVEASASAAQDRLIFCVTDTGIGISPALQTKLFRPFQQGEHAGTPTSFGMGLGLAICHELVSAMGGTITVESEPGKGAAFRFELPVRKAEDGVAEDVVISVVKQPQPPAPASMTLLIAEDNDITREMLRAMLEQDGHDVVAVADGKAAVELAQGEPFDAVILDYRMPVMDGVEAARALRSDPRTRAVPLIALSADLYAFRQEHLHDEFDMAFEKPVDWRALRAALSAIANGVGLPEEAAPAVPADLTATSDDLEAWSREILDAIRGRRDAEVVAEELRRMILQIEMRLVDLEARGVWDDACAEEVHSLAGLAATFGWQEMARLLRRVCKASEPAMRSGMLVNAVAAAKAARVPDWIATGTAQ